MTNSEVMIMEYSAPYERDVQALVLGIQTEEAHFGLTLEAQPDLQNMPRFFKANGGGFWVALSEDELVGTIGLQKLDLKLCALRTFFLLKEYRGNHELQLAQRLFDTAKAFSMKAHFQEMWLDTPCVATASQRFYERHGFERMPPSTKPEAYLFSNSDSLLYRLELTPSA